MTITLDEITDGIGRSWECSKDAFIKVKDSGHLYSALFGAGAVAILSLGLRGCQGTSDKASENLKPKVDFSQPSSFDLNDNKLYFRYDAQKSVPIDLKTTADGIHYIQGRDGGDVLVPAKIDSQGNLIYK